MPNPKQFSRREFLKLVSLSLFSVAAAPHLGRAWDGTPPYCPVTPKDQSVLSPEQRHRLAAAAQSFVAADIASARQVALDIDFIEGRNEDASTMCGPLSIAILQRAGLLGAWARPHDFWLLNPRINDQPLENTFPAEFYDWHSFETPISTFDFSQDPLQAGDLVYLHAGTSGTFEHVLVVNRVDESGRAFAVTNFFIATGTIIEERMLYDPQQSGSGQFAAWADRSIRNTIGNTGDGGFRVWRVKDGASLEFPGDAASRKLREGLDALLLAAAGEWHGVIAQIGGPRFFEFDPYAAFHPASTIKVPIAMAFYEWLEAEAVDDWSTYLSEHGVQGRTYAQLLEAMLVNSEEEATEVLVDFLGKAKLEETWKGWGLVATHVDPRRSSASEIMKLFEGLYMGKWLKAESRAAILELMETYTANDEARIGTLRPRLPEGTRIYNKRGSLVDWPRVVADSAILQFPGTAAPAFIFTLHGLGKGAASYEELEATLQAAIDLFGDFLEAQS